MLIRVLRATLINGLHTDPGTVIDVEAQLGRSLVLMGKASEVLAAVEASTAAKKQPAAKRA